MPKARMRLDKLLVHKGLVRTRQRAQALVMEGKVRVEDKKVVKPGTSVSVDSHLELIERDLPFVSRGGLKLAHALDHFHVSVSDLVAMDVGASTGGFTDCLLQNGAKRVYAVDVGYGQLAWTLRTDSRVICLERQNIRYLSRSSIPEIIDIAVVDVSFISLKLVLPVVRLFLGKKGKVIALIKPQFEVGKGKVGKGGVVRDLRERKRVVEEIIVFLETDGWSIHGIVKSPILGPKGNEEFLLHASRT